jgi:hypothetical protein
MDVKVFVYGLDFISLICVAMTLYYAHTYKGTRYFSPIVENMYNALSWIGLALAIMAFCLTRWT